jgi:hypothetical protein
MSQQPFRLSHYETFDRYRRVLQGAKQTVEQVKTALGLTAHHTFIKLHQPALNGLFIQIRAELEYWPDELLWGFPVFYHQSVLAADIHCFCEDYSRVSSQLTADAQAGALSALDFSLAPFALKGRLKVLNAGTGYRFASQLKQRVFNLYAHYDQAAFKTNALYLRSSNLLPRLIDFMEGAIKAYADIHRLDPLGADRKILAVRATIETLSATDKSYSHATMAVSEGYSNMSHALAGATDVFKTLFQTTTVRQFMRMSESVRIRFEQAEKLIQHTQQ